MGGKLLKDVIAFKTVWRKLYDVVYFHSSVCQNAIFHSLNFHLVIQFIKFDENLSFITLFHIVYLIKFIPSAF